MINAGVGAGRSGVTAVCQHPGRVAERQGPCVDYAVTAAGLVRDEEQLKPKVAMLN